MSWFIRLICLWMFTHGATAPGPAQALVMGNMALRQQLSFLQRRTKAKRTTGRDRLFSVAISRFWPGWKDACLLVKPTNVLSWHRAGFKAFFEMEIPNQRST